MTMPAHHTSCPVAHAAWGEIYCRCFIEKYLADKIAAPAVDARAPHVLMLPELRGMILSFLPMPDLARAARLTRDWRDSVRSASLQRQLFARPDGPTVMPVDYCRDLVPVYDTQLTVNPRLVFDLEHDGADGVPLGNSGLHASLAHISLRHTNRAIQSLQRIGEPSETAREAQRAQHGLKQYLTQPPCSGVLITTLHTQANGLLGHMYTYVVNNDGVTLDDILDTLRRVWLSSVDFEEQQIADFLDTAFALIGVIVPAEQSVEANQEGQEEAQNAGQDEEGPRSGRDEEVEKAGEDEEDAEVVHDDPVGWKEADGSRRIPRAEHEALTTELGLKYFD